MENVRVSQSLLLHIAQPSLNPSLGMPYIQAEHCHHSPAEIERAPPGPASLTKYRSETDHVYLSCSFVSRLTPGW